MEDKTVYLYIAIQALCAFLKNHPEGEDSHLVAAIDHLVEDIGGFDSLSAIAARLSRRRTP